MEFVVKNASHVYFGNMLATNVQDWLRSFHLIYCRKKKRAQIPEFKLTHPRGEKIPQAEPILSLPITV